MKDSEILFAPMYKRTMPQQRKLEIKKSTSSQPEAVDKAFVRSISAIRLALGKELYTIHLAET